MWRRLAFTVPSLGLIHDGSPPRIIILERDVASLIILLIWLLLMLPLTGHHTFYVAHAIEVGGGGSIVVSTVQSAADITDMVVDSLGRVLFTDLAISGSVHVILPNGTTTVLATGFFQPRGLTIDTVHDVVYVSDSLNSCIKTVFVNNGSTATLAGSCGSGGSVVDGPGTAARFNAPIGIVYHATGVLYVCDMGNAAIRGINISTATTSTVVQGGAFSAPRYLCINRAGTILYVTDDNCVIVRVNLTSPTTPVVKAIAGMSTIPGYINALGNYALFNYPNGIALDDVTETTLYVVDNGNLRVRSVRLNNFNASLVAGVGSSGFADGPPATAMFANSRGAKWYCNTTGGRRGRGPCGLLVADNGNNLVRLVAIPTAYNVSTTPSSSSSLSLSVTTSGASSSQSFSATPTQSPAASRSTATACVSRFTESTSLSFPVVSITATTRTTTLNATTTVSSWTSVSHPSLSLVASPTNVTSSVTLSSSRSTTKRPSTTISNNNTFSNNMATPSSTLLSSPSLINESVPPSNTAQLGAAVDFSKTISLFQVAPPPPTAVDVAVTLRDGIAATTPVLQYSLGSVSTSARSISRMGAVSRISQCTTPFAPPKGLLSFPLLGKDCDNSGVDDTTRVEAAEYARGDAVLAVSVMLVVGTVLLTACCLRHYYYHQRTIRITTNPGNNNEHHEEDQQESAAGDDAGRLPPQVPFQDSVAALAMPSLLLPMWGAAVPTGVNGIVQLSSHWLDCPSDGVLVVFAIVIVVACPLMLLWIGIVWMMERLVCTERKKVSPSTITQQIQMHQVGSRYHRVTSWAAKHQHQLMERRWDWVPRQRGCEEGSPTNHIKNNSAKVTSTTSTRLHLYGRVLVLQHRVLWYASLDATILIVVAALAAFAVDRSLLACQALGGTIIVLLTLQLLVCVTLMPFTTLLDHVVSVVTLTLNVLAATCQLVLLSATATDGSNNATMSNVTMAAATVDLLLLGVTGMKAGMDIWALCVGMQRRWRRLLLEAPRTKGDNKQPSSAIQVVYVDNNGNGETICGEDGERHRADKKIADDDIHHLDHHRRMMMTDDPQDYHHVNVLGSTSSTAPPTMTTASHAHTQAAVITRPRSNATILHHTSTMIHVEVTLSDDDL